jgi:uncharacterized damage-inducible protein DinB
MHPMLALVERSAWANQQLLDFCTRQPAGVVTAPAEGDVYGGIDALFTHIVAAECDFVPMITGKRREPRVTDEKPMALADLVEPMRWAADRWPGALDFDRDPEVVFQIQRTRGPAPMTDWLALLHCIHHSDDHRNQVATVLSRHAIEPPELDLWAFGAAFGFERVDMHPGPRARRDSVLRRAFGHHAWATDGLLKRCLELSPEQLALTAPGTYGSILDTFDHMVSSDRSYLSRLRGTGRKPPLEAGALEPLLEEFRHTAEGWLAYLDSGPDFDAVIQLRDGDQVGAWVIVAQAIHHGNDHRTHIGTTMMHNGLTIPEIDPWTYAESVKALQLTG